MPIMLSKKTEYCAVCRFCTHEDKHKSFMCHNEDSKNYGKLFSDNEIKEQACENFTAHTYNNLSLKDALHIETQSDDFAGAFYLHKLPDEDGDYAYVTLAFKTNAALEEWRDAHLRLFIEYMNMANTDGDFKEDADGKTKE